MKKLLTVVAILLLLVAIIGVERIGSALKILITDDRVAGDNKQAQSASAGNGSSGVEDDSGDGENRGQAPRALLENKEDTATLRSGPSGQNSIAHGIHHVSIRGEISQFHFIRSRKIFGEEEPTKRQRAILAAAAREVLSRLDPGVTFLDADVTSNLGNPVIVFGAKELDVTDSVKLVYESLLRDSVQFVETEAVE